MQQAISIILAGTTLMMSACTVLRLSLPVEGDSYEQVVTKLGPAVAIHQEGEHRVLVYPTGPMGQHTWMARMGSDNRLLRLEQVLTSEKFAAIKPGTTTRSEVLRTLGPPAERSHVSLRNFEVWSYRYKESDVWNSMMHVHFDARGLVQLMQNAPDPMYEDKRSGQD